MPEQMRAADVGMKVLLPDKFKDMIVVTIVK